MTTDFLIRTATRDDLPEIASIHLRAYSRDHFTSRLPVDVLVDYYGHFLSDGAETVILSGSAGDGAREILGFAVFGRNIAAKIAQFKQKNAVPILKAALRHPIAAGGKTARSLWTRAVRRRPMVPADYLLLSIAVSRPGQGAGPQLLDACVDRAEKSGAPAIGLYVNASNLGAINTYATKAFLVRELYGGQYYMERRLT